MVEVSAETAEALANTSTAAAAAEAIVVMEVTETKPEAAAVVAIVVTEEMVLKGHPQAIQELEAVGEAYFAMAQRLHLRLAAVAEESFPVQVLPEDLVA